MGMEQPQGREPPKGRLHGDVYPELMNYPSYGFEEFVENLLTEEGVEQFNIRVVFERDFSLSKLAKLFNKLLECKRQSVEADSTLLDCVMAHVKGDQRIGFCVKSDVSWTALVDKLSGYGDMWRKVNLFNGKDVDLLSNQATFEHFCALTCIVHPIGESGVTLVSFLAEQGFPLAVLIWLHYFLDAGAQNFFGCVKVVHFHAVDTRFEHNIHHLINNEAFVLDLPYAKACAALV